MDCAAELAALNTQHLADARKAWGIVMGMIRADGNEEHGMRALVSALADCQKIARLSLGASTTIEVVLPPPPAEPEIDLARLTERSAGQATSGWQLGAGRRCLPRR